MRQAQRLGGREARLGYRVDILSVTACGCYRVRQTQIPNERLQPVRRGVRDRLASSSARIDSHRVRDPALRIKRLVAKVTHHGGQEDA